MKHIISYKNLSIIEADKKAIADIRFYLGDRFDFVVSTFRREMPEGEKQFKSFDLNCQMFLGIEGFPVEAFHRHIYPFG